MKKFWLIACLATVTFFARAQTRGTNTIGLGVNINSQKAESGAGGTPVTSEMKDVTLNVGYGFFIKDNARLGFDFTYGTRETDNTTTSNSYGGTLSYQNYYPLVQRFYAFAGGRVGYTYSEINLPPSSPTTNMYSVGAYGGVNWFLSKRFSLEADLLSADVSYSETKSDAPFQVKTTNFRLNTTGIITGLGFKIYFLF